MGAQRINLKCSKPVAEPNRDEDPGDRSGRKDALALVEGHSVRIFDMPRLAVRRGKGIKTKSTASPSWICYLICRQTLPI